MKYESSEFMHQTKNRNNLNLENLKRTKIFQSLQLEDLEFTKKNSFQLENDFEVISKDSLKDSTMSDNYIIEKQKRQEIHRKIFNNVKTPSENNSNNKHTTSIWSSFSKKISDIKNNLKYNIITTNSYANFYNLKWVRIFEKIFIEEEIKNGDLFNYFEYIMQFTYRSDFHPINFEGVDYISDCGWGCMIRAAQMMLSKCILENKIFSHIQNNKTNHVSPELLKKLKYETLLLFLDNFIRIEDVTSNQDFYFLLKNLPIVLSQSIANLKFKDEKEREGLDKITSICIDEYVTSDEYKATEINPPFSIQNICKLGAIYEKGAGIWFSDVLMVNIFCDINRQFNVISNLELINFNDGIVDEQKILDACFEELKCAENCTKNIYSNINRQVKNESLICGDCEKYYLSIDEYKKNIIKKGKKYFIFKKGGIVFTSVRLGLESIGKEYFESIRHIFKIPNNLGIIGGKRNSALYFIGEFGDRLIYLDPHMNQSAIIPSNEQKKIDTNLNTYSAKYFYQTNISNISPAFTSAFYFRNLSEYVTMNFNFNIHMSFNNPVFKFRSKGETSKNDSNKNLTQNDELDYGFCLIDYK